MHTLPELGPLFQWAARQETRRPTPRIVRRIAQRGRISELHAVAFCQANGLGGECAR